MTTSYFVRYEPTGELSNEFLNHYRGKHAEMLKSFPGIQALHLHTPVKWNDPESVRRGRVGLLAQLVFESSSALDAALKSDARAAARYDFKRFPRFSGQVIHQAMSSETLFTSGDRSL